MWTCREENKRSAATWIVTPCETRTVLGGLMYTSCSGVCRWWSRGDLLYILEGWEGVVLWAWDAMKRGESHSCTLWIFSILAKKKSSCCFPVDVGIHVEPRKSCVVSCLSYDFIFFPTSQILYMLRSHHSSTLLLHCSSILYPHLRFKLIQMQIGLLKLRVLVYEWLMCHTLSLSSLWGPRSRILFHVQQLGLNTVLPLTPQLRMSSPSHFMVRCTFQKE